MDIIRLPERASGMAQGSLPFFLLAQPSKPPSLLRALVAVGNVTPLPTAYKQAGDPESGFTRFLQCLNCSPGHFLA